jgi:hypothetical protein
MTAMRTLRGGLLVVLMGFGLAACGGGGHAAKRAKTKPHPGPAARFRAVLVAPTHTPRANTPWIYAIHVTDSRGRPIRARVRMQVLFGGIPVGPVDNGKTFSFVGTWKEPPKAPVIWPTRSRGQALTFEALVTARGQTRKLDYAIRVR